MTIDNDNPPPRKRHWIVMDARAFDEPAVRETAIRNVRRAIPEGAWGVEWEIHATWFEGFKPRPKEPTLPCAVVRDKEKRLFIRSDDTAQPWRLHAKGTQCLTTVWFPWSQIPDPEVLFEGVPE